MLMLADLFKRLDAQLKQLHDSCPRCVFASTRLCRSGASAAGVTVFVCVLWVLLHIRVQQHHADCNERPGTVGRFQSVRTTIPLPLGCLMVGLLRVRVRVRRLQARKLKHQQTVSAGAQTEWTEVRASFSDACRARF